MIYSTDHMVSYEKDFHNIVHKKKSNDFSEKPTRASTLRKVKSRFRNLDSFDNIPSPTFFSNSFNESKNSPKSLNNIFTFKKNSTKLDDSKIFSSQNDLKTSKELKGHLKIIEVLQKINNSPIFNFVDKIENEKKILLINAMNKNDKKILKKKSFKKIHGSDNKYNIGIKTKMY